METVLLIDVDRQTLKVLSKRIESSGYSVEVARSGVKGLALAESIMPDLIVTELALGDLSGTELLDSFKRDRRLRLIPLVVVSSRSTVQERIEGLSHGADDYIAKPFDPEEVFLRIRSLLKRSAAARTFVRSGPFLVDRNGYRCFLRGKPLELTSTEYRILTKLLDHPDETVERKRLIEHVWYQEEENPSRSLDTHMKRLRMKLGVHAKAIRTVRNRGFRFVPAGGQTGASIPM